MNRKSFLGVLAVGSFVYKKESFEQFPISCSSYNWTTFYRRKGKEWGENMEEDIKHFALSGMKALEPSINDLDHAKALIKELKRNDILLPSIYVNSILHEKNAVEESINKILEIASEVKKYGTKIIVTNPNPLKWGSKELKTDEELKTQATALELLNEKLKSLGLRLAYHTHDMEMAAGAREFHHMMQNTTVGFCFDVHWIYRGSGNSALAVFDVLKMYGERTIELHIRQSKNEVWSETFTAEGDIDYKRLANELSNLKMKPLLVIEQCLEADTTQKYDVVEAHKIDLKAVLETFQSLI